MSVACVVQARMGSSRFPGKVLEDLAGMPMLAFQLRRLEPLNVDYLIVATTTAAGDDRVSDVATSAGALVVRGSEHDVLSRFNTALEQFPVDTVIRLTADCPLSDPEIIARGLRVHKESGADYTSNTLLRTFPDGLDVEIIAADALRIANEEAQDPTEREHVTPFVYRDPDRFHLEAFRHSEPLGDLRWTVDTPADLERLRHMVGAVANPEREGWHSFLVDPAAHEPTPDRYRLAPASPDDQALLSSLSEARDMTLVGEMAPASAPRPMAKSLSTRTWVLLDHETACGWWAVHASKDTATLCGAIPTLLFDTARALLDRVLAADHQVKTLIVSPSPNRHPIREGTA
jgi:spore coat polysaccharide biosynthesis protein SpsF